MENKPKIWRASPFEKRLEFENGSILYSLGPIWLEAMKTENPSEILLIKSGGNDFASESGNRKALFSQVASMHSNQQVSLETILFILPRKQKWDE